MGVTYKKDVKDLRKSPPLELINLFKKKKVKVDYYDPIIPYLKIEGLHQNSVDLRKGNLKEYDCVIIATDHTDVDYAYILEQARLIFDVRNIYKGKESNKVVKL